MRIPADSSLCLSCRFAREVQGRLGRQYLLCRNEAIAAKYPPQPVRRCPGYERRENSRFYFPLK
jgi:hypothetical protein